MSEVVNIPEFENELRADISSHVIDLVMRATTDKERTRIKDKKSHIMACGIDSNNTNNPNRYWAFEQAIERDCLPFNDQLSLFEDVRKKPTDHVRLVAFHVAYIVLESMSEATYRTFRKQNKLRQRDVSDVFQTEPGVTLWEYVIDVWPQVYAKDLIELTYKDSAGLEEKVS
ncbi:hypothetical protein H6801_03700 [Candidatus Nomurabacteria bacterium]|nr:hypothetical protein [Candidatus Nomurabacteria bacterium]